jgi:hypothetical protein
VLRAEAWGRESDGRGQQSERDDHHETSRMEFMRFELPRIACRTYEVCQICGAWVQF